MTFRVALDLVTLKFLLGYATRPLHFFGKAAFFAFGAAFAMACDLMFDKLCQFLEPTFANSPLAISFEIQEIHARLTYKKNNLRDYMAGRNKSQ